MNRPLSLRLRLVGTALILGLAGHQIGAGEDEPARASAMLARMNDALRSLNYEGTLVYLLDDRMETLHLAHRVDEGRVQERLVSLSGPVRTVSRDREQVTCVMPDGHPITIKNHTGRNLLRSEPIDPAALAERYRIQILGTARVAGRDTDVIAIRPRDDLRYGYQFYLDRASGLPLKSDLLDPAGQPREQLMFTSIELHQAQRGEVSARLEPAPTLSGFRSDWRFDDRPAGFEPALHDRIKAPDGAQVEHFVFSDRLSAYSVYIEPEGAEGLEGVTRVGAVHAAGRRVAGHQVTAVGEVPAATVEAAVAGVRQATGAGEVP